MLSGVRTRLLMLAADRPLQVATVVAALLATAAAAAPLTETQTRASLANAVQQAVETVAPPAAAPEVLVWEGADVDGDGKADFANPTGNAPRTHDAYGDGEFGSSRDGGSRRHEGVDFKARAGQQVEAPISGYVTKIGYAYPGDQALKFVEITNPALQYEARVFYVDPRVEVGEAVEVGKPIGAAHTLQRKYPGGMTDHVHLELMDHGAHIDAKRMITAEYVPAGGVVVAAAD